MFFKFLPLLIVLAAWPVLADGPKSVDGETLRKQAAAELKKKDADGDGALTLEEFLAHAPDADRLDRTRRFLVFDFDDNHKLDGDEFYTSSVPIDARGDVPDPLVEAERAAFKKWEAIAAAADRDGDGALRLYEWPAERIAAEFPALADVPFVLWEHDEDGKVNLADARWLFEVAYGLTQADGRPLRTSTGRVFSLYYFRNLDSDRDEVLSRDEFISGHHSGEQNAEIFATLDADRDGRLTDRETWSLLWHDTITEFLNYDSDRDGSLSPDEMQAIGWGTAIARQCVPAFDDDEDGRLSFREFRQTTFANQASAWSLRHDTDQDGRLSWAEFFRERSPLLIAQSRFMFDHFDRNHDGFLSAREFTIEGDANQQQILAQVRPLERCLPLEVEFAQHVCDLTDEQTAALERAGWFAIERLTDQVAENLRRRNAGDRRLAAIAFVANILSAPRLAMRRELVRVLQPGSDGGISPLVLQSPPDLWKKLDAEFTAAAKRRRQAAVSAHVALLDETLLFTDRQRQDLCRLLGEETNDAWWRPTNAGLMLNPADEQLFATLAGGTLGAFAVPEAELAKRLTAEQFATLKELEQPWPQEMLLVRQAARRQAVPAAKAPAALGNKVGAPAQRAVPMAGGMFPAQAAQALVIQRVVGRRLPVEHEQRWYASYVTRRLDDIDAACGLSATQREKLSLAAKLDVARWRDQRSPSAGEKLAAGEELIVQQVMTRGGQPFSWAIFEESASHFKRSLRSQLLADQKQKLLAADRARADFRRQALVEALVTGFETAASLTADQCDALTAEFKAEAAGLDPAAADWPVDGLLRILQASDERLRAIVHGFQWERFETKRGIVAETLRQYELRQRGEASVGNAIPGNP